MTTARRVSFGRASLSGVLPYILLSVLLFATACAGTGSLPRFDSSRVDQVGTADLRLLTFNVRYGLADDGANSWSYRRELVFDVIRDGAYDVVGLQEALPIQVAEIGEALAEFDVYYRTREVDPNEGEACALLFRRSRWHLLEPESGTLWLSETPQEPGSKSWDSSLPRILTWASLEEKATGQRLNVINTHFDHRGAEARVRSAELVWRQAASLAESAPVVVMGDFNAGEDSEPLGVLTRSDPRLTLVDSYRVVYPDAVDAGTFNSWRGEVSGEKIDGVLVDTRLRVLGAEILRDSVDGRFPSDHYPVSAVLGFPFD